MCKQPPLSGLESRGLWFTCFPVTSWGDLMRWGDDDVSGGLVIAGASDFRVVIAASPSRGGDARALSDFNFKGFKYNPDLLQLRDLAAVVLAYLEDVEIAHGGPGSGLGSPARCALMIQRHGC